MARFLRSISFVEAAFFAILLSAAFLLIFELIPMGAKYTARAGISGPPIIDVSTITVDPPATGSSITVKTLVTTFDPDEIDTSSTIAIRNVTRDTSPTATQTWSASVGRTFKVTGGMGDVLEITCNNGTGITTETIGLVPSPTTESAPPTFDTNEVTPSHTSGTFSLQIDVGGILDQSFDVTVLLSTYDGGSTDSHTFSGSGGASTDALQTLSVTAGASERVFALLEDDYGNVNEYHYVGDQLSLSATTNPAFDTPDSQVPSEYTGNALMVPVGDGNTFVTAKDRQLIHRHTAYLIDHAIHDYPVSLTYRSDLEDSTSSVYDGPFGLCFDSPLNMRVVSVNTDEFEFYPGDGRVITGFDTYTFDFPSGTRTYESPAGIFFQLVHHVYQQKIVITYASGTKSIFEDYDTVKTFYLTSMEDSYASAVSNTDPAPNQLSFIRNDDHQVIQIIGDGARVTRLAWFAHGRLAEIQDQDRVTLFDYDSSERLVQITRPDDSTLDLTYDGASELLTHWTEDRDTSPGDIDVFEATYLSGTVTDIEDRHTLAAGQNDTYEFTALSGSDEGVGVEDPTGATVNYAYIANSDYEKGYVEYEALASDRNTSGTAPSFLGDDPVVWSEHFELNSDRLLPEARWLATNTSGSTWELSDEEHWTFPSLSTTDPRLNARISEHRWITPDSVAGIGGNGTVKFTESWTYGSDAFPTAHTSFDGVTTDFTYDTDGPGRVESRTVEDVHDHHWLGSPTLYDVVTEYTYNTNGQIASITEPNRSTAYANWVFYYFDYGTGRYRVEKRQEQSNTGANGQLEEYTYTAYGEVATRTAPTTGSAERVWEKTYDALGRVSVALKPEVTVGANTIRGETEYVYGNNGFDLEEIKRKFYDEDGVAGSGSTGDTPSYIITVYTYDAAGRVQFVEGDYEARLSLAPKTTKKEYAYTARGKQTSVDTYFDTGVSDYDRVSYDYDARGRLLTKTQVAGVVDYETWYRYDGRGREVERFEPTSGDPTYSDSSYKTTYDVYGRVEEQETPWADLDAAGTDDGHYLTETLYSISATDYYSPVGTKKRFISDSPAIDEVVAHTQLKRDNANRVVVTSTWYKGTVGTSTDYASQTVRLYPDGSVRESHTAEEGIDEEPTASASYSGADWDHTATVLDTFDRPYKTSVHVAAHGSTPVTYTERVYNDATGWVAETKRGEYDEVDSSTLVYVTKYDHDELGRVTQANEWGTAGSAQEWSVTSYDGLGRVWKQYRAKTGETGVVELTAYDLVGKPLERERGLGITDWSSTSLHSRMEWTYDRAGRQLTETMTDGSNPRTVTTTYDALGRVTELDHYRVGVREYTYSISTGTLVTELDVSNLSSSLQYTRTTTTNALGKILEEDVDYPTTGIVGQKTVRYTYGDSSGCGCSSNQGPIKVETFDAGSPSSTWMTRVTRSYSPRGEVLTEEIEVNHGSGVSQETSMTYNALGQMEQVVYPDQPGTVNNVRTVDYTRRSDGFITTVEVDSDDVAVYESQGVRAKLRSAMEYDSLTATSIADTTETYDVLGRLSNKNYSLEIGAWGSTDFDDEVESRNVDGRIKTRTNHPVGPSFSPTSATMVYVGDNWLSEQEWFTDRIQTQTYERNEFGEVYDNSIDPSMTDEALGCSPGYYNVDLDYSRNSAGQLTGISGDQGLQISSDNGSTTPSYTKSSVSGRSFTYDGLGRMERRYADVTLLDGDCGSDCLGGAHSGYQYNLQERDVEYAYDAWGRSVEETIKVTQTEFTQDCSSPTSGTAVVWSNYELERIYDGYGRLVYSEAPMNALFNASREVGLYHAYAGGQRIMTAESGGSSNEESFEELFPGAGGQVDKYYRSRSGSGWGNVGSGFATNLYDVTGNVFLSNGSACSSPPFDGGECAFPTYGRLWTVSRERATPPGEAQLGDDSPYMLQESDGPEEGVVGGEVIPGGGDYLAFADPVCRIDSVEFLTMNAHKSTLPAKVRAHKFGGRLLYHQKYVVQTTGGKTFTAGEDIGFDRNDLGLWNDRNSKGSAAVNYWVAVKGDLRGCRGVRRSSVYSEEVTADPGPDQYNERPKKDDPARSSVKSFRKEDIGTTYDMLLIADSPGVVFFKELYQSKQSVRGAPGERRLMMQMIFSDFRYEFLGKASEVVERKRIWVTNIVAAIVPGEPSVDGSAYPVD